MVAATEYKLALDKLYTNNRISFTGEHAYIDINLLNNYYTMKKCENKVTYAYKVPGISIKCEEVFENASKTMYLKFTGTGKILDKEVLFDQKIYVDTNIYNRYDWKVSMGVLYVTLFEIINERPDFSRVEKKVTTNE